MIIYGYANPGPRVRLSFPKDEGRTKQADTKSCDINLIMAKFIKTGAVEHSARHAGSYGFATSLQFHDAMNLIRKADGMFAELPAVVRDRFGNDSARFLDFVQDPSNHDEMVDLGLSEPRDEPAGSPPASSEEPPAGVSEPPATSEAASAAANASD